MPQNRKVPIGIVGSGFIVNDCHLPAYRQAGFHAQAIASRNVPAAREVALRHHVATVHETVQDLLNDKHIEVLDIAVPPHVQRASFRKPSRSPTFEESRNLWA